MAYRQFNNACGALSILSNITVFFSLVSITCGVLLLFVWLSNPSSAPDHALFTASTALASGFSGWMFGLMGQALVYIARKD